MSPGHVSRTGWWEATDVVSRRTLTSHFSHLISHFRLLSATLLVNSFPMNTLYYGDNLNILRDYVKDESVDLVYLAPAVNGGMQ